MLSLLIAATVAAPAAPSARRFRCGIETTQLVMRRGGAFLTVGRAQYILRPARSGSGARWVGNDDLEFWEKGGGATLKIGKRAPVSCIATGMPQAYRAVGQEPGWSLDIDAGGRSAVFKYDYARKTATEPLRAWAVAPGGDRVYTAMSGRLTARITTGGCQDAMSGQSFADTVTVTHRRKTYRGCGGSAQ